jgi:hypothetical protein
MFYVLLSYRALIVVRSSASSVSQVVIRVLSKKCAVYGFKKKPRNTRVGMLFVRAQTVSTLVPPYSTVDNSGGDEHQKLAALVTSWRTEVTDVGLRVVQLTADIRVSPLVEQGKELGEVAHATHDTDKCEANYYN